MVVNDGQWCLMCGEYCFFFNGLMMVNSDGQPAPWERFPVLMVVHH